MSKDNNIIYEKQESVNKLPEILQNGTAYRLLISNRGLNFRRNLFDRCNDVLKEGTNYGAWKMRFHYPQNIPSSDHEKYSKVMADCLSFTLQEQVDYLIDQKKETDELISKSLEIINQYNNE